MLISPPPPALSPPIRRGGKRRAAGRTPPLRGRAAVTHIRARWTVEAFRPTWLPLIGYSLNWWSCSWQQSTPAQYLSAKTEPWTGSHWNSKVCIFLCDLSGVQIQAIMCDSLSSFLLFIFLISLLPLCDNEAHLGWAALAPMFRGTSRAGSPKFLSDR